MYKKLRGKATYHIEEVDGKKVLVIKQTLGFPLMKTTVWWKSEEKTT